MVLSKRCLAGRTNSRQLQFTHKCHRRRGAATVEFAVIAPLFFMLVMGMFEFSRMMMAQEILTNGAREGARKAVLPGVTTTDVTQVVNNYFANTGISGHTVTCTPDPATAQGGTLLTVTVNVSYRNVSWLPAGAIQWLKSENLTARVVMRKEEY